MIRKLIFMIIMLVLFQMLRCLLSVYTVNNSFIHFITRFVIVNNTMTPPTEGEYLRFPTRQFFSLTQLSRKLQPRWVKFLHVSSNGLVPSLFVVMLLPCSSSSLRRSSSFYKLKTTDVERLVDVSLIFL